MALLISPVWNGATQKNRASGPAAHDVSTPADSAAAIIALFRTQELYYSNGVWYIKDMTTEGNDAPVAVPNQAHYDPPFRVRQVTFGIYPYSVSVDADGYLFSYNDPYALGIVEHVYAGVTYPWWVTRVLLNANTTMTKICLKG